MNPARSHSVRPAAPPSGVFVAVTIRPVPVRVGADVEHVHAVGDHGVPVEQEPGRQVKF
jgi:hypothetical protein